MFDAYIIGGNTLINSSRKDHGVNLLCLLDLLSAIIKINFTFFKKMLIFSKKHFKLDSANENCNVRIIGDPRQEKLEPFLALGLTPITIDCEDADENIITFKEKSLYRNPFNYYLEYLSALVVNNSVNIFVKGNYMIQEKVNHKNLVYLCGELVSEPVKCVCVDGRVAASIELGITEYLTNTFTGEEIESTEFHRVLFFGQAASDAVTLKFRDQIEIEGKLAISKWSDVHSKISTAAEVWAHRYTVLNKKSNIINFKGREE